MQYFIDVQYPFTNKGYVKQCAYFPENFNSVFSNKQRKFFVCAVQHVKKRRTDGNLEYSLLITKIHYISRRCNVFEGQSRETGGRVMVLVIKPFGMPQKKENEFNQKKEKKKKKCQVFPNPIFWTIPHINSTQTTPLLPCPFISIVNVVCKYLRHFIGISFGTTTLTICYVQTLGRGEGHDLFLQSGPFHNLNKLVQELTWP